MTADLFTLYKPAPKASGLFTVFIKTGAGNLPYKVQELINLRKLEEGEGHVAHSYLTDSGWVLIVRNYYKIKGWEVPNHPDTWATCPLIDLVVASNRGRIMRAILGSPYDLLYRRTRSAFPDNMEDQLRCAALCRLTLKELRLTS